MLLLLPKETNHSTGSTIIHAFLQIVSLELKTEENMDVHVSAQVSTDR